MRRRRRRRRRRGSRSSRMWMLLLLLLWLSGCGCGGEGDVSAAVDVPEFEEEVSQDARLDRRATHDLDRVARATRVQRTLDGALWLVLVGDIQHNSHKDKGKAIRGGKREESQRKLGSRDTLGD